MPRPSKAIGLEPSVPETISAAPAERKGAKAAAIRQALDTHPDLPPKEIARMLQAEGWDITAQSVSVVKSNLKSRKEKTKKAARTSRAKAAKPTAATAAKDTAVSLDSLKKAKELAAQLGGIKQAKEALAALSELLD